jgi:3D-(3,5/4)-trihydroxycyclohexane-1,2-dione acylhydrolase (decyclizing)
VYVLVGDGSYLMMAQEIATAVQEGVSLTVLVLDNQGFASIGGLSASVGCEGFGTHYRRRSASGELDGEPLAVDFVANATSLGAEAVRADTTDELRAALERARGRGGVQVVVVPVDRERRVGGYDAWWDVPVAEVSPLASVQSARADYEAARRRARVHLLPP